MYWHIDSPRSLGWTNVVDEVIKQAGGGVHATTSVDWLTRVRGAQPPIPAVKLLGFFSHMLEPQLHPQAVLDVSKTISVSPLLAGAPEDVMAALPRYVEFASM